MDLKCHLNRLGSILVHHPLQELKLLIIRLYLHARTYHDRIIILKRNQRNNLVSYSLIYFAYLQILHIFVNHTSFVMQISHQSLDQVIMASTDHFSVMGSASDYLVRAFRAPCSWYKAT